MKVATKTRGPYGLGKELSDGTASLSLRRLTVLRLRPDIQIFIGRKRVWPPTTAKDRRLPGLSKKLVSKIERHLGLL